MDQLSHIDEKINRLKKQRERLQTQQAVLFYKEAQKILENHFSPDMALSILSDSWRTSTDQQKEKWKQRGNPFRPIPIQKESQKLQTIESPAGQS